MATAVAAGTRKLSAAPHSQTPVSMPGSRSGCLSTGRVSADDVHICGRLIFRARHFQACALQAGHQIIERRSGLEFRVRRKCVRMENRRLDEHDGRHRRAALRDTFAIRSQFWRAHRPALSRFPGRSWKAY